jgi:hypothetical protein
MKITWTCVNGSAASSEVSVLQEGLRALFGIHIARIACAYDLEVDSHLVGILPPEPD